MADTGSGEWTWPTWLSSFIENLGKPDTMWGAGAIGDWAQQPGMFNPVPGSASKFGSAFQGAIGSTVTPIPSFSRRPNFGSTGNLLKEVNKEPNRISGPPSATQAGGPQFQQPGMTDWNGLMGSLNEQRQFFVDQRNRAISAAGRGAGAPYAAQIAQLDSQIAKAQQMMAGSNQLFGNKIAATNQWWDQSISKIGLSYDESLDRTRTLNAGGLLAVDNVYSESQSKVLSVLNTIPGMDETTKTAAVGIISDLEDEIINMETVSGENALTVMQASEDLAVAIAGQSKANTELEFTRQRLTIEAQLKEQINGMLEARKAASRAQGAAMQAARDMEAARLPDNFPLNEQMLAGIAGNDYLNRSLGAMRQVDKDKIVGVFGSLYGLGITPTDARKLLTRPVYNPNTGAPMNASAQILDQYNLGEEKWYGLFGTWGSTMLSSARQYLPYALQLGAQATTVWNSFKGLDPNEYDPNSAEYAFIVAANMGSWASPDEISYAIGNPGPYLTPMPGSSAPTVSPSQGYTGPTGSM